MTHALQDVEGHVQVVTASALIQVRHLQELKLINGQKQYQGFNITFQVTEDCNMACRYCYEVAKRPGILSLDYAKRFIDIILTDPDPIGCHGTDQEWILAQGLVLDFIGGDALMVPDLCDDILTYFQYKAYKLNHRWKNRWRVSISTNGTLLGKKEVQKFLMKYKDNISLGISVDGCPELHDKNRIMKDGSGSMAKIMENWDWYMSYASTSANTKSTLNKESIPYIYESIKFLHETLGLRYINMNFIFEDMHLEEEDYIEIDNQLSKVVDYIYEHKDDMHLNMLSEEFGIGDFANEEQRDKGWCGAGAMPCLSINGNIYPCFRFSPNTMHRPEFDFSVGDVWTGFSRKENFIKVREQTRNKISSNECKNCAVDSTCAWCIGGAFSETGTFYRQTNLCRVKKIIDKHARRYWNKFCGYPKYGESIYC